MPPSICAGGFLLFKMSNLACSSFEINKTDLQSETEYTINGYTNTGVLDEKL